MERAVTKTGKAYYKLTDAEVEKLPEGTRVYNMIVNKEKIKAIPPIDCEHELLIRQNVPKNIVACKKCILWEYEWETKKRPGYEKLIPD